ncbi:MAG: M48 family metalloprotease [Gemmatimonadetes bacterium]|nr:M48 family metalloprotease [Gemmatimonadota bacterium]MYB69421.1 M48 family metalloprotease [Gemmatimonadota bacterium]
MNAALNELGNQLFGWFSQLSIELAALAVLVLVTSRLLSIKSPALRHLLWAIVLLKPLVSIAVSSPYTLFTPFASLLEPSQDTLAFSPVEVQAAASPTIATNSVPLTTAGWGAILWIVGAALLIGRILIGYGIVWCLRQQAQVQHDGPLCDALQQARRTLDGYPKVEVATSPSISSPMALGILRPIIVFPADLVKKLSADKLSLILMHELAHVRRWDNLTLLLQRLISAVLFFHPAVWLCGRMLRREAEQACDDLVVCVTGRSEAYARGLAHVAEQAAHLNPLIRRIPTMNAFAAESDLALRIRRTLGGSARRMGMRARVLAVVLLCPLAVVTLPSCGITSKVSKGAAESSSDNRIWRQAMATDPDEWSEELKTQLLMLKPGSTIEEIAEEVRRKAFFEEVRQRMPYQEAPGPDEWPDELKAQLRVLKPVTPTISYEIATATSAELAIYDVAGWHVRTFALDHQSPGKYSIVWDGRDDAGRELSDGLYFYRLKTEDAEAEFVGKTMLVR